MFKSTMNDIGQKIKILREESGLTQLQLAHQVGCSKQVISNIERGCTRPAADLINKIAACFSVPSDYILGLSASRWIAESPSRSFSGLSKRIASRMGQLQMDQQTLCSISALPSEECSGILRGEVTPNTDTLAKLSIALQTSVDYLIGSTDFDIAIATEDEQDIVCYYRSMSKKQKRLFMGALEKIMETE